jgi:hypothetical protein
MRASGWAVEPRNRATLDSIAAGHARDHRAGLNGSCVILRRHGGREEAQSALQREIDLMLSGIFSLVTNDYEYAGSTHG